MDVLISFLTSIAATYAMAGVAILLLRSRLRVLAWGCAAGALSAPLIIPATEPFPRAAASILSLDCAFRLVDLLRTRRPIASLRESLWFIVPFPVMNALWDWKRLCRERWIARPGNWRTLIAGCVAFAVCWGVLDATAKNSLLAANHLLDHTFKLILFVAAVESGALALCAVERLVGFQTTPIVNRTWEAVTPAEFWRRWNDRIHAWLYRHIFRTFGGTQAPVRAILATCVFSGLFHELMFGISTSRFDGYQLAFFTIQAPAILLSPRLQSYAKRRGALGAACSRAITIAWFWATSLLFFHGIDRVIPIHYTSEPWLP